jgi:hypothetical protein
MGRDGRRAAEKHATPTTVAPRLPDARRPARWFLAGDDVRCAAADEDMLGQIRDREGALAAELERIKEVRARASPRGPQQARLLSDTLLTGSKLAQGMAVCSRVGDFSREPRRARFLPAADLRGAAARAGGAAHGAEPAGGGDGGARRVRAGQSQVRGCAGEHAGGHGSHGLLLAGRAAERVAFLSGWRHRTGTHMGGYAGGSQNKVRLRCPLLAHSHFAAQAAKVTCARKVEERKAELASRKQQLADVLQARLGGFPAGAGG